MSKIVTIHQPNYLPWIGLFSKIVLSDCLIIYDIAQYTSNSVINRNKIRTNNGFCYLTIPIEKKYYTLRIKDVPLPENRKWQEEHWKTIYQNYARAPYFKYHAEFFAQLYKTDFKYLWQINEKILLYLLESFDIKVEILKASELNIDSSLRKTDMLIACLKCAGTDVYLSGPSGKNYLEYEKFSQNQISLKFFKFNHPVYKQRYPGFESNLSAIDLLFNLGPEATIIIKNAGVIEA